MIELDTIGRGAGSHRFKRLIRHRIPGFALNNSIAFEGRVRLRVDFNPIGLVVAVEPVDGAVVIEA